MTPKSSGALSDTLISDLGKILNLQSQPIWLADGEAVDIQFESNGAAALSPMRAALDQRLMSLPVDYVLQTRENRRKRLLIADMDSTMIGQECIDELAGEVGLKDQVSAITERAMRGEIQFEPALRERVALLAGLSETIVGQVIEHRITLTPGARTLVQTMRRDGAHCALVSGGFTAFTKIIADKIGFHENSANSLTAENGLFTGTVAEPILGREAKRERLQAMCVEKSLDLADTLAVGDGANDLDMVTIAGLGIAYHAKPALIDGADAAIRFCDLTALLFAQGYSVGEFVA